MGAGAGDHVRSPRYNGEMATGSEGDDRSGSLFATEFFMARSNVHAALEKLTRLLAEASIPYALVGAMALNEYGYRRVTEDIDILLTKEGLQEFRERWLGRGYVEKFKGSRGMRDAENDVEIDVVIAGDFPGDGKPKEVAFPEPEEVALERGGIRVLPIELLIELKLASGLSAPHRLRDLADVLELIRHAQLGRDLADQLDPSVREKYLELWDAAQMPDAISDAPL